MNLERLRILKDVADRPTRSCTDEWDWQCCLAARAAGEFGMPVEPGSVPDFGNLQSTALSSYGIARKSFAKFFGISAAQAERLCSAHPMSVKRPYLNKILAKAEAKAKADKAKRVAAKRAATMAALVKLTEPGAKPVADEPTTTGRRKARAPMRV